MIDPTTRGAWLVQGEQELGPQRRCIRCRSWWPLEPEFWQATVRLRTHLRGRPVERRRLARPVLRRCFEQPCRSCRAAEQYQRRQRTK